MSVQDVDILMVEDNPLEAKLMESWFRSERPDWRIHSVGDGDQALDFLFQVRDFKSAPRPAAVLLDLNLPTVSGFDVLKEVKADITLRDIPIIVVTASAIAEDVHRADDLQADGYVSKPANVDEFIYLLDDMEELLDPSDD